MVHGQRRHHDLASLFEEAAGPRARLQHVRDQSAVRQHRAFGPPGGAAGVLQEGDIGVRRRGFVEAGAGAAPERGPGFDGAPDMPFRHHLLHMLDGEVHQQPAVWRQQIANLRGHHVLDRCVRQHCFQHVRKVLQDDNYLGAGVLKLMLQFARGVQGIDVHHNHAGATITYAELDRLSRHFAAWLEGVGLAKAPRVALMMPNLLQYPVALFGVLRAGMIVVNINPLYTARELEHQLKDSGAEVIVILENFAHVLETVLANTAVEHVVSTQVGDLLTPHRRLLVNFAVKHMKNMVPEWHIGGAIEFRTALGRGARARLDEAAPSHADIAFLQYTGGTTGRSKGAMLTHGGLVANMLQARAWSRGFLEEGSEIVVTALPMYHVFSLTTNCLLFIKLGGLNLLITNPRDMPGFVKELNTTPWTVMTGVNTLFNGLLNTPGFEALDFSRLKFALGGGAAVHRTVAERWQAVTRRPIFQGYGLTETSPFVTCSPLDGEYSGSIGLPIPSTEIAIMDDENRELPPGAEGEICVKGPQVMAGRS